MPLETELQFYEEHRKELAQKYRNLFVLIRGNELIGVFPDAESAHQQGVNKFGMEPFFVRQVLDVDPVNIAPIASLLVGSARL